MGHTLDPWRVIEIDPPVGYAKYEIQYGNDGECVAEVVHEKSDADLMAAAPDLLEALEMVRAMPEFKNFWSDKKQIIEKAIGKAYGDD
jgi:hypothetical protein